MKRLYLEQQQIPITDLSDEQTAKIATDWPVRYLVTKVIGSTTPKVRSYLAEVEAKGYCEDEAWQVEIV